ncbi:MAG TPA: hypothetical protein ACFYD1_00380, partial [Candidatus Hypogeohydataceae bacterium YC38]
KKLKGNSTRPSRRQKKSAQKSSKRPGKRLR